MSAKGGTSSSKRWIAIALVLLLAVAAAGYLLVRQARHAPPVAEAPGIVEGRETNIASKIPGRLKAVYVREGDAVRAGDLLAEFESEELRAVAAQATASLGVARATWESGREGVANAEAQLEAARAEVETARAGVVRAEARLAQAEKDLARDAELYKGGILPRATEEAAETERDTRRADLQGARAALAAAEARAAAEAEPYVHKAAAKGPQLTCYVDDGAADAPRLLQTAARGGASVQSLAIRRLSLEDVFLHHTGRSIREEESRKVSLLLGAGVPRKLGP